MQIYGPSSAHGPHSVNHTHLDRTREPQTNHRLEVPSDEVEISDMAQVLESLSTIPDVRQERIDAVREAIANGTYETDEKLNAALERLLDEIA